MEKNQKQPTDPRFSAGIHEQDTEIRSSAAISDEALDAVNGGILPRLKQNDDEEIRRTPAGASLKD